MTRLRKMMLDELERRNYSQTTRKAYLLGVEQFAKHFDCSPDRLGLNHIRDYQAYLFRVREPQPASVAVRLAALRFLFVAVLKRRWSVDDTPYPKRPDKLPTVLTQEEVARMIEAALTPLHRVVLVTFYATGLRRAELTRLRVSAIDTERIVIHVVGGKGRKESRCDAQPQAPGRASAVLEEPRAQASHLALPRRSLAHRHRASDDGQGGLVCLRMRGQAGRYRQGRPPAHLAALLLHAPARSRRRSPNHSVPDGP
jgi:site-specific recombinase XerD